MIKSWLNRGEMMVRWRLNDGRMMVQWWKQLVVWAGQAKILDDLFVTWTESPPEDDA